MFKTRLDNRYEETRSSMGFNVIGNEMYVCAPRGCGYTCQVHTPVDPIHC